MTNNIHKAEIEGERAFKATRGNPYRVEVPYHRHTALWRSFSRGWNKARKERKGFEFLKEVEL